MNPEVLHLQQPTGPGTENSVFTRSLYKADRSLTELKEWLHDNPNEKIRCALRVLFEIHRSDIRKTGETFVIHPMEVALFIIRTLRIKDEDLIIAALLHDSYEEHPKEFPLGRIERLFGERVAEIIGALTVREIDSNRLQSLDKFEREWMIIKDYQQRVKEAIQDNDVFVVKLGDFINNALGLCDLDDRPELQARLANKYLNLLPVFVQRAKECAYTRNYPEIAEKLRKAIRQVEEFAKRWRFYPLSNPA